MRLVLAVLLTIASHFASAAPPNSLEKSRIEKVSLASSILPEERQFEIYVPARRGPNTRVIYVLDGQAQFDTVVKALTALGETQHFVVGIGNIWLRERDYTPTAVSTSDFVDERTASVSGGARAFVRHLEQELFTHIEARFGATLPRVLVGHSLGGLLALDLLFNQPRLFAGYVVIDPSLWWDDASLLRQAQARLQTRSAPAALFLAIANSRNRDRVDIDAVRADATANTALIRPSVLLLDALRTSTAHGIGVNWHYYRDEDHMSVVAPAVKDGLAFVLK